MEPVHGINRPCFYFPPIFPQGQTVSVPPFADERTHLRLVSFLLFVPGPRRASEQSKNSSHKGFPDFFFIKKGNTYEGVYCVPVV